VSPTTTRPCPSDQQSPLTPGRSTLADVALSQGVSHDDVRSYLDDRAGYLSAPYRFVATVIGLQSVSA